MSELHLVFSLECNDEEFPNINNVSNIEDQEPEYQEKNKLQNFSHSAPFISFLPYEQELID
jgi:hypothetical protein